VYDSPSSCLNDFANGEIRLHAAKQSVNASVARPRFLFACTAASVVVRSALLDTPVARCGNRWKPPLFRCGETRRGAAYDCEAPGFQTIRTTIARTSSADP
jgi:hypothetical protein